MCVPNCISGGLTSHDNKKLIKCCNCLKIDYKCDHKILYVNKKFKENIFIKYIKNIKTLFRIIFRL